MPQPLRTDGRGSGGTPVLFVHSFAGDLAHWASALEHLSATRRVVAFDLSGHGGSPTINGRSSIRRLAEDVAAVANAQGLEQYVLVGHSMGALVAAEHASNHPQRVRTLVLVDPPPAPGSLPPEALREFRTALEADPFAAIENYWHQQPLVGATEATRARLLAGLRRMGRNVAIDLTLDLLGYDATLALRRYPGPKFAIVTPANDQPLSLQHAVPDIEYAVIEGTSHWIHLDKPDQFNRLLDRFLRR